MSKARSVRTVKKTTSRIHTTQSSARSYVRFLARRLKPAAQRWSGRSAALVEVFQKNGGDPLFLEVLEHFANPRLPSRRSVKDLRRIRAEIDALQTHIESLGDRDIVKFTIHADGTARSNDPEMDALRRLSVQVGNMIDRQLAWYGRDRKGPRVSTIAPYYWIGALVPYMAAFMGTPRWTWLNEWLKEQCPQWRTARRTLTVRGQKTDTDGQPDVKRFWYREVNERSPEKLGQTKAAALRGAARVFFRYRTLCRAKNIPRSLQAHAADPDVAADRRPWGKEERKYISALKDYLPFAGKFFDGFLCTHDLDEASKGRTGVKHWMFDSAK